MFLRFLFFFCYFGESERKTLKKKRKTKKKKGTGPSCKYGPLAAAAGDS